LSLASAPPSTPLKKTKSCELVIVVVVRAGMDSMTTCVCPMIWPCALSVCGLAKYVLAAFVNVPSWMPCVLSVMLKDVLAGMVSKLAGLWNLDDGMAVTAGMLPMGIGLQEPVVIWRPLVMVWPAQKFMKLFVDVAAALCPVTGGFWPSSVVWITDESKVRELWSPPEAESGGGGAVVEVLVEEVVVVLAAVSGGAVVVVEFAAVVPADVAPVAAMRAVTSAGVVQAIVVPATPT